MNVGASRAVRVCAVVVTYNRLALLKCTLAALLAQRRPLDAILVLDNACADGTTEWLRTCALKIDVLRLANNAGGAGGFAAGIDWAISHRFDWAWLMDDDVTPDGNCLAELLDVAAVTSKRVVVPRRLEPDGADCAREAVLVESTQRIERVRTDPSSERYRAIDLFTFEGPLIHRSVVDAVGLPDGDLFIHGDDLAYGVVINRSCGPLSCALAAHATIHRQLPSRHGRVARSRVKAWLTGDPFYTLLSDADHWKMVYGLRNLHLISRRLGWRRMAMRVAVAHLGYTGADLLHSMLSGWDWSWRLRWNLRAWVLGVRGNATKFLEPESYRARLGTGNHGQGG